MSLAARCPACGTVFRVVQDQLRVSEGWVRCGRCAEVFNAIETLVDLDTEAATRAPAPARSAARTDRVLEDLARVSRPGALADDRADGDDAFAREAPGVDLEVPLAAAPATGERSSGETMVERSARRAAAAAPENTENLPRLTPAFVAQADRAARWRRPGVRFALAAVSALGLMLLAGQALVTYRDTAAARWPVLQGPLAAWCELQGCRLGAPRFIEGLAVESSGLVRGDGPQTYRLNVVLRNRTDTVLALPAIDLTLTDTQGAVIARRIVRPAEIGVRQAAVPAHGDLPLQAQLVSPERPISGYTIEIFYP